MAADPAETVDPAFLFATRCADMAGPRSTTWRSRQQPAAWVEPIAAAPREPEAVRLARCPLICGRPGGWSMRKW